MKAKMLSSADLSEWLLYEPDTGNLVWKKNFHTSKIGRVAGTINSKGYVVVKINGGMVKVLALIYPSTVLR